MNPHPWLLAPVLAMTACAATPVPLPAALGVADDEGPARIDPERVGIVIIDAQPTFWSMMHGDAEPVMERLEQLLVLADITGRPLLATFEDPPQRNGWLPDRLEQVFPKQGRRVVKKTFDCCREPMVAEALRAMDIEQIVLAGAETDVCVLQSALGLRAMGYEVFLLEDCVFSNERFTGPALRRMTAAGVVPCTYKTFFFEMMGTVDVRARPAWQERRREIGAAFKSPYQLTPSTGTQSDTRTDRRPPGDG